MMHAVPRWRVIIAAAGLAVLCLTFEADVTAQQLPDPNAPLTFMVEPDTNRPGQDFRSFALAEARPELCRQACVDEPRCQAFTYVKPGIQGPDAVCWLKSEAPAPVPDSCCYSGVKLPASGPKPIEAQLSGVLTTERRASPVPMARDQLASAVPPSLEPDTNRPGKDFRSFPLAEARPEACLQACAEEPQCQAFTYVKPGIQGRNAVCWLKSEPPAPVPDACCVSGVKTRAPATGADLTPIQLPGLQAPPEEPRSVPADQDAVDAFLRGLGEGALAGFVAAITGQLDSGRTIDEIAVDKGVSTEVLKTALNEAQLAVGLGLEEQPNDAKMLRLAGVESVKDLANQDPERLHERLQEIASVLEWDCPTLDEVRDWVERGRVGYSPIPLP